MGSGSSKDSAAAASSSVKVRKPKPRRIRVFDSSCFGLSSILSDGHQKTEENERPKGTFCADEANSKSSGGNDDDCDKAAVACHNKLPLLHSSDVEQSGEADEGTSQTELGPNSSSSNAVVDRSSGTSGRLHSRFNFIPDGISFRLNRAVSLGSSGSRSLLSTGLSVPRSDMGEYVLVNLDSSVDRNDTQSGSTLEMSSSQNAGRINAEREATFSQYSNRSFVESRNTRHSHRRLGPQEPLEGSVRFSRTLSVGRLRDRVLRRTPFSDGLFYPAFLEDRSVWSSAQASGRRALGGARRTPSSHRISGFLSDSSSSNLRRIARSMDIGDDSVSNRRTVHHDALEHRSAFLERRRRIRSQVRALQRLGSRFESLSGHDRSCILSGQHRTGRCTCRTSRQTANPDDDTNTRASISRIVMLAEALFEVLDEIHQQSIALSSRPSFSSIGSVPAPKEVVECIPIKIYNKPSKTQNEEAAQCYICLVEYEEGDCIRMLPCNHEFHRTCIDKWLKEIHRVCPLCRGDVCSSDALNKQKLS
ncbi:uncharacterized protein LOC135644543 [Musa acuminata AAA Group]|uniref:(wild Malaysian banana) hypothetical protein n=1 Tax=Musa acuminata subsp. malaccensis TaxID=214687 RepID=A0A804K731_MUSAM|nr:PREDICTED: uncharacterized protein LOC103994565 [Musa acuminata subsp. malaccensis]CAG1831653.1 unnamed protein product [Musa acuminata subsp. malaccensis]